jgi:hypothetical protein
MMGHREKLDGREVDALLRCKRYLHWQPGERKHAKRGVAKRVRKAARQECLSQGMEIGSKRT